MFLAFIIFILYGFLWRAKGGAIPLGSTTLARIVFFAIPTGLVFTLLCYLGHFPYYLALIGTATAFGAVCIGHASAQGNTNTEHAEMSLISLLVLFITFLPIIYAYHTLVIVILTGLLSGLCYYVGYKITKTFTLFGIQWCKPGDTSWGEIFTGWLSFGLAMAESIVLVAHHISF